MQINTSAARLSSVNVVRFWLIPLINESPYFSYLISKVVNRYIGFHKRD